MMVLGSVASAVVLGLLALALRRRWGWVSAFSILGLVWWLVVIALVTLVSPYGEEIPSWFGPNQCSFDYDGPAPDGFWIFDGGQRLLNTLLFIPAGFLLMHAVLAWRRVWLWAPLGMVALIGCSVAIEWAQSRMWQLGRACDVTDVVDNGIGAVIGVVLGVLGVFVVRFKRSRAGRWRKH